MARRGREDSFVCRFADRGSSKVILRPRARGKDQPSIHRFAARGSDGVDPEPRDFEIKRLQQRVQDLEASTWKERKPTNGDTIYYFPPVYDEYEDDEWYSWMTGESIIEDERISWKGRDTSIEECMVSPTLDSKVLFGGGCVANENRNQVPVFTKFIFGSMVGSINFSYQIAKNKEFDKSNFKIQDDKDDDANAIDMDTLINNPKPIQSVNIEVPYLLFNIKGILRDNDCNGTNIGDFRFSRDLHPNIQVDMKLSRKAYVFYIETRLFQESNKDDMECGWLRMRAEARFCVDVPFDLGGFNLEAKTRGRVFF